MDKTWIPQAPEEIKMVLQVTDAYVWLVLSWVREGRSPLIREELLEYGNEVKALSAVWPHCLLQGDSQG